MGIPPFRQLRGRGARTWLCSSAHALPLSPVFSRWSKDLAEIAGPGMGFSNSGGTASVAPGAGKV